MDSFSSSKIGNIILPESFVIRPLNSSDFGKGMVNFLADAIDSNFLLGISHCLSQLTNVGNLNELRFKSVSAIFTQEIKFN